ncbi:MAG: hypothetical protein QM687_10560 [Ferruginibacter sp.]
MKKSFKKVAVVLALAFAVNLPLVTFAQPEDPCTDPAIPCPIDGGLSLLLAAGIGLGAKKAYDRRKATKS